MTIYVAMRQIYCRGLRCGHMLVAEGAAAADGSGPRHLFPENNKTKLGGNGNFKVCFNE